MSEFAPDMTQLHIDNPPSEVIEKTTIDNPPSEVSQPEPIKPTTYVAWYARKPSKGYGGVLYTNRELAKKHRLKCSVVYGCDDPVLMRLRKRSSSNIFHQFDFYCKDCFETYISTLDGICINTSRSIMSYCRGGTDIMFINQGDAYYLKQSIERRI